MNDANRREFLKAAAAALTMGIGSPVLAARRKGDITDIGQPKRGKSVMSPFLPFFAPAGATPNSPSGDWQRSGKAIRQQRRLCARAGDVPIRSLFARTFDPQLRRLWLQRVDHKLNVFARIDGEQLDAA